LNSRVLIVEDRTVIANNLHDRLEALGYSVSGIATSGEESVELAARTQPNLILMDIRLPGEMDGIEAADSIRQRWDIPVVYLTGHADQTTVDRAKVTEPHGYLLKPFNARELRTAIEMALYKHSMERRLRESEKKYRHLVEQSLQGIVIIGSQAPWLRFANARCAEISGHSVDDLLALEPSDLEALIHPGDREYLLTQVRLALSGQPFSPTGEFRFLRVTGDVRWVEYHASSIEHRGEPALQAAMVDITERKKAEKALRDAHNELEQRVICRTADLARANQLLTQEIAVREQAQSDLSQHADELKTLSSIGQQVSATLLLDEVTQTAIQGIAQCLAPDLTMLYLRQGNNLHLKELYPAHPELEQQMPDIKRVGECLCGLAAAEGKPVYSQDIWTDPRCTLEECKRVGMRSFAALPLLNGNEVQGVLGLASSQEHRFSERASFLEALSADISIGLQNALLHQRVQEHAADLQAEIKVRQFAEDALRRRNRELALLNRIISATTGDQEIEGILQTVCRELVQGLDLSHAIALLRDGDSAQASVVAAHPQAPPPSSLLGRTVSWEDHPAFLDLLVEGQPLILDSPEDTGPLVAIRAQVCPGQDSSLLVLPLITYDQLIGGLGLCTRESGPFTDEDLVRVKAVADQASAALARARLQETQRLLSTVVRQTAEAVLIIDTDNKIVYVNSAFERLTGFDRCEALGATPGLFRSDWHDEEHYHQIRDTIGAGQVWQGRLVSKRKDGSLFPVKATITPLRNRAGQIENTVATLVDLSREVQLEEQVRHTQKMEALGHLAGGVAHDFNNMLTVIRMASTMIERHLSPADPLSTFTGQIQETITRATRLTKQLLSFSRRDDTSLKATNLNHIIDGLGWMLQRLAGSRIQLQMKLDEDLLPVQANTSGMEQVIMNLVVNARDAMPEGGSLTIATANRILDETLNTEHGEADPGAYVMLRVSDTGIGMDDEVRARIFEPFFTTKGREQGTGLGLSTVQQIVQQAGGTIHVDTELGRGTSFQILLPARDRSGLAEGQDLLPVLDKSQREGTILIIEDDPIIRELSARQLTGFGYQVQVAGSGPEALELCQQIVQRIQLALVDVVLPSMDGLELVQELHARQPEMRVLYMSGYDRELPLVRKALESGAAFLRKPFDLQTLTAKVQEVLAAENGARSRNQVTPEKLGP
jgi:PAS domain S-box-containing protein